MKKKQTRGGKRRGAGRPDIGAFRANISITPTDDATAKQLGDGDRSKGIRAALDAARKASQA